MDPDAPSIRLPAPAVPPAPPRIPVVAALAPVAVSGALYLVTGSPLTLLFAVLGPLTAVASLADAAIAGARHRRREAARLAREASAARERIRDAHAAEREARRRAAPSGPRLLAEDPRAVVRWRTPPERALELVVGTGAARSGLVVEGERSGPVAEALAGEAARLPDAPLLREAALGIGVAGPLPVARAVARGLAAQALAVVGPARAGLLASGPAWGRALDALPHARLPDDGGARADSVLRLVGTRLETASERDAAAGTEFVRIVVAEDPIELAPHAAVVVDAGARPALLRSGRGGPEPIRVEPLDAEAFAAWCRAVASLAAELGAPAAASALPDLVSLGDLIARRPPGPTGAVIGAGTDGPVVLDLAADGPHAVIGGTTGSGKSELLVTWITAMAAGAAPEDLAFLLVDFKGGAGFAPVAGLPHVVGVVTDLDAVGAARAVGSLGAEVRRREAALAAAGLRAHEPGCGLPRLVVVVDEYAALVETQPELHALFADLAARGRSLGIHLVVGTQRPSASVRDAVLANADVRVSLRVRDRADAIALVGRGDAAELPAEPRGRAVASIAGRPPALLQTAIVGAEDIAAVAGRWAAAPRPRRPWREPLPDRIPPERLTALLDAPAPEGSAVIGAIDRPDLQAIEPWVWRAGGVALVLGAPGSGRTGLLAAVSRAAPAVRVPAEPAAAWDAIEALAGASGDHGGLAVLLDDLDLLAERLGADYRQELIERVLAIARAAPRLGMGLVVTAASADGAVRALEPLVRTRILLRLASRQEHLLAGGAGSDWDPRLPPGGAIVEGRRAQLVEAGFGAERPEPVRRAPLGEGPLAVVAAAPAGVARRLAGAGRVPLGIEEALAAAARGGLDPNAAVVADPVSWQARWGALETIGASARVLGHGLDAARFRTATGLRALPPPLPEGEDWCWLVDDGRILRARLP